MQLDRFVPHACPDVTESAQAAAQMECPPEMQGDPAGLWIAKKKYPKNPEKNPELCFPHFLIFGSSGDFGGCQKMRVPQFHAKPTISHIMKPIQA